MTAASTVHSSCKEELDPERKHQCELSSCSSLPLTQRPPGSQQRLRFCLQSSHTFRCLLSQPDLADPKFEPWEGFL